MARSSASWPRSARAVWSGGERHHVHLAADHETAHKLGARRGAPVVLAVRAASMVAAGHAFFRSANGVWLTDHVPAAFLDELPPR
ncbi:MAG TPA: RNA 2'-phosphotransferase [Kofleriaceae bacterium]|nr:RNA 2'-phosphotransferase [Kofleriaceae bacterium]